LKSLILMKDFFISEQYKFSSFPYHYCIFRKFLERI
uniref:Uncharacterized protein n=1 Tax=Brugia timori TaxID=42155 RepID=A0A0R3QCJ7_9BILA